MDTAGIGLALLLAASPLVGQEPARAPAAAGTDRIGAVRGTVYDSLLGAPLSGARVTARGTGLTTTTDGAGRFRLDSLPAGTAVLAWSHPGLDSAGLSNLSQRVEVLPDRVTAVRLTVPSLATLRRAACPPAAGVPDSGLILGAVSDAETGERIAGAFVKASWISATRDVVHGYRVLRPGLVATTDSLGNYYGCAVSTDLVVNVQAATADGFASGVTEVLLGRRGVVRHDVTLSREDVPGSRDSSGLRRGLATVLGMVRTDQGVRLQSAEVFVEDGAGATVSDRTGRFMLAGQPSGSHVIMARMVGYTAARRFVDLRNRDTLELVLVLERLTVLDTLRITATNRIAQNELDDLAQRMRFGFGHFLTEEDIRGRGSIRSVFQGLPFVQTANIRGSQSNFRIFTVRSGRECEVTVWVDGVRQMRHDAEDYEPIQDIRPDRIVAVEYYPRAISAPVRFQNTMVNNPECAILVVWTKYYFQ